MPGLVKFLLRHAAFGFAMGAVFSAAVLYFDIAGIGTLIITAEPGIAVLAAALQTFFLGLTFGSVQMGIALMTDRANRGGNDSQTPSI